MCPLFLLYVSSFASKDWMIASSWFFIFIWGLHAYKNNWDDQLALAIFAYRIAHQNKLRSSLFYQYYGRELEIPDTVSLKLPELWLTRTRDRLISDLQKQTQYCIDIIVIMGVLSAIGYHQGPLGSSQSSNKRD